MLYKQSIVEKKKKTQPFHQSMYLEESRNNIDLLVQIKVLHRTTLEKIIDDSQDNTYSNYHNITIFMLD